jgi:diguanylate cyclase (GGDEF)-like protein
LLTSKDEKGDILAGLETGANDYIRKPFDPDELYARIRVGQRNVELQTSLYETKQILAHQATHDFLTGILNRGAILEQLSKELSRIQRSQDPDSDIRAARGCSIGFFDIDRFKEINDKFGHQAGDQVLKEVVGILGRQLRPYDSFGRLGGDEFLVVAPEIEFEKSRHFFERLLTAITLEKSQVGLNEFSISVSLGVASTGKVNDLDKLLECADAAMYRAKRAGGNRVVYAWDQDSPDKSVK